jgi:putative ABC transport system substrate-binding protein
MVANIPEAYRKCGLKITRILKGEKPADLAIEQSTKITLTVNLKTAKALGLTIPNTILALDEESAPSRKLVRSSRWESGPSKG